MEASQNKILILALVLLLFAACSTERLNLDKSKSNSYLIKVTDELRYDSTSVIDIAEEFYLLTKVCEYGRKLTIDKVQFSSLPIAIDHPIGVETCCADLKCNNSNSRIDLRDHSYMDNEDLLTSAQGLMSNLSDDQNIQIIAIEGDFCICDAKFAQIKHEGFDYYVYFTRSLDRMRQLEKDEVSFFKKGLQRLIGILKVSN